MKIIKSINKASISFILFIAILLISYNLSAQKKGLFIPIEYQNAIERGTRTTKGIPGKNYWQNKIKYKITADFNPENGLIQGKETILYTNNSPHNMYTILFNLYPDLYKKGNKRDSKVDINDLHDGTKITSLILNDKKNNSYTKSWNYSDTHFRLNLPTYIKPNETMKIELSWEFSMAKTTHIRNGKYSDNTWFVSYWYPQIAVYDDIYDWDNIPYDGLHEFYSPFADFDVEINVPAKQIIWATGELQNPKEILKKEYLEKFEKSKISNKVIHIVEKSDLNKKITRSNENIKWHYKADNVVDFAFSTSDHYLWDATSIIVDKETSRRSNIHIAYNQRSRDFYSIAEVSKKSLEFLSNSMPGIPYPYPTMTVFNGHGGMEYPMIVNDGSEFSESRIYFLTSHEIAHTYFPFYMGINQKRFAWMDEGWTMFLPEEFQSNNGNVDQAVNSTKTYSSYAGKSLDLPLMTASFNIKDYEYYISSYYKPEMAYRILQDYLGKELFLKCIQTFIQRWNGKYTSPYDFFYTFNDVAEEDLSWFWNPWFFEFGYPDLAITSVNKQRDSYDIIISKKGNLPTQIYLEIIYEDGTNKVLKRNAKVWENKTEINIKHKTKKKIRAVKLGNDKIPDIDLKNNTFFL